MTPERALQLAELFEGHGKGHPNDIVGINLRSPTWAELAVFLKEARRPARPY